MTMLQMYHIGICHIIWMVTGVLITWWYWGAVFGIGMSSLLAVCLVVTPVCVCSFSIKAVVFTCKLNNISALYLVDCYILQTFWALLVLSFTCRFMWVITSVFVHIVYSSWFFILCVQLINSNYLRMSIPSCLYYSVVYILHHPVAVVLLMISQHASRPVECDVSWRPLPRWNWMQPTCINLQLRCLQ